MSINIDALFQHLMEDPDIIPPEGENKEDIAMAMATQREKQANNNIKALNMAVDYSSVEKLLAFTKAKKIGGGPSDKFNINDFISDVAKLYSWDTNSPANVHTQAFAFLDKWGQHSDLINEVFAVDLEYIAEARQGLENVTGRSQAAIQDREDSARSVEDTLDQFDLGDDDKGTAMRESYHRAVANAPAVPQNTINRYATHLETLTNQDSTITAGEVPKSGSKEGNKRREAETFVKNLLNNVSAVSLHKEDLEMLPNLWKKQRNTQLRNRTPNPERQIVITPPDTPASTEGGTSSSRPRTRTRRATTRRPSTPITTISPTSGDTTEQEESKPEMDQQSRGYMEEFIQEKKELTETLKENNPQGIRNNVKVFVDKWDNSGQMKDVMEKVYDIDFDIVQPALADLAEMHNDSKFDGYAKLTGDKKERYEDLATELSYLFNSFTEEDDADVRSKIEGHLGFAPSSPSAATPAATPAAAPTPATPQNIPQDVKRLIARLETGKSDIGYEFSKPNERTSVQAELKEKYDAVLANASPTWLASHQEKIASNTPATPTAAAPTAAAPTDDPTGDTAEPTAEDLEGELEVAPTPEELDAFTEAEPGEDDQGHPTGTFFHRGSGVYPDSEESTAYEKLHENHDPQELRDAFAWAKEGNYQIDGEDFTEDMLRNPTNKNLNLTAVGDMVGAYRKTLDESAPVPGGTPRQVVEPTPMEAYTDSMDALLARFKNGYSLPREGDTPKQKAAKTTQRQRKPEAATAFDKMRDAWEKLGLEDPAGGPKPDKDQEYYEGLEKFLKENADTHDAHYADKRVHIKIPQPPTAEEQDLAEARRELVTREAEAAKTRQPEVQPWAAPTGLTPEEQAASLVRQAASAESEAARLAARSPNVQALTEAARQREAEAGRAGEDETPSLAEQVTASDLELANAHKLPIGTKRERDKKVATVKAATDKNEDLREAQRIQLQEARAEAEGQSTSADTDPEVEAARQREAEAGTARVQADREREYKEKVATLRNANTTNHDEVVAELHAMGERHNPGGGGDAAVKRALDDLEGITDPDNPAGPANNPEMHRALGGTPITPEPETPETPDVQPPITITPEEGGDTGEGQSEGQPARTRRERGVPAKLRGYKPADVSHIKTHVEADKYIADNPPPTQPGDTGGPATVESDPTEGSGDSGDVPPASVERNPFWRSPYGDSGDRDPAATEVPDVFEEVPPGDDGQLRFDSPKPGKDEVMPERAGDIGPDSIMEDTEEGQSRVKPEPEEQVGPRAGAPLEGWQEREALQTKKDELRANGATEKWLNSPHTTEKDIHAGHKKMIDNENSRSMAAKTKRAESGIPTKDEVLDAMVKDSGKTGEAGEQERERLTEEHEFTSPAEMVKVLKETRARKAATKHEHARGAASAAVLGMEGLDKNADKIDAMDRLRDIAKKANDNTLAVESGKSPLLSSNELSKLKTLLDNAVDVGDLQQSDIDAIHEEVLTKQDKFYDDDHKAEVEEANTKTRSHHEDFLEYYHDKKRLGEGIDHSLAGEHHHFETNEDGTLGERTGASRHEKQEDGSVRNIDGRGKAEKVQETGKSLGDPQHPPKLLGLDKNQTLEQQEHFDLLKNSQKRLLSDDERANFKELEDKNPALASHEYKIDALGAGRTAASGKDGDKAMDAMGIASEDQAAAAAHACQPAPDNVPDGPDKGWNPKTHRWNDKERLKEMVNGIPPGGGHYNSEAGELTSSTGAVINVTLPKGGSKGMITGEDGHVGISHAIGHHLNSIGHTGGPVHPKDMAAMGFDHSTIHNSSGVGLKPLGVFPKGRTPRTGDERSGGYWGEQKARIANDPLVRGVKAGVGYLQRMGKLSRDMQQGKPNATASDRLRNTRDTPASPLRNFLNHVGKSAQEVGLTVGEGQGLLGMVAGGAVRRTDAYRDKKTREAMDSLRKKDRATQKFTESYNRVKAEDDE